jgi:hypothetical protein
MHVRALCLHDCIRIWLIPRVCILSVKILQISLDKDAAFISDISENAANMLVTDGCLVHHRDLKAFCLHLSVWDMCSDYVR